MFRILTVNQVIRDLFDLKQIAIKMPKINVTKLTLSSTN